MNDKDVRALKVMYVAQAVGATLFAGVVFLLALFAMRNGTVPSAHQSQVVHLLSMALIVFSCVEYTLAGFLFRKVLKGQRPANASALSARIRTAYVIRVALFQGMSFFGLAVCLLAGSFGVLHVSPLYVLTGLPYVILIMHIIRTYPSKGNLDSLFNELNSGALPCPPTVHAIR